MRTIAIAALCAACGPAQRDGDNFGTSDASPTDTGADTGRGSDTGGTVYVYAHTDSVLYRVDPDTLAITQIGPFVWSNGSDTMTDIAIDKNGQMIGVSFSSVYHVDTTNAHATRLTDSLGGTFNGLSFVPAEQLVNGGRVSRSGQGEQILVGVHSSSIPPRTKRRPTEALRLRSRRSLRRAGYFASSFGFAIEDWSTVC